MSQHIAVFDQAAFYPLRNLVEGPFESLEELEALERFVRAIVLHDDMIMVPAPSAYDPEAYEELKREHPHQWIVITAWMPAIDTYDEILSRQRSLKLTSLPNPSVELCKIASQFSNAEIGNPYYNAHIEFLQVLLAVEKEGGSVVCDGEFARVVEKTAREYPQKLFEVIDADWKEYASNIDNGYHGPSIPPVLGIVLNRCKNRDDIPIVLRQLRDEWSAARTKVWELITSLRTAKTLKEANQIKRELAVASIHFSPKRSNSDSFPFRVLWELFAEAGGESIVTGGNPLAGVTVATARTVLSKRGFDFAKTLFGRGALDLARRVRRETMELEPMPGLLSRFLTQAEKDKLGL